MASVAQIVEELVLQQPFLADALQRGLINYGALADELLPKVQPETKRLVKHAAVMMALRRLAEKLEKQELEAPRFSEESNITIQSNMFELTVTKSKRAFERVHRFREHISPEKGELLTVTQGLHELTIISNRQHRRRLKELLEGEEIKNEITEVSLLTIRIPDEAIETPGYFYTLTRALAWESINIVEMVSTFTGLTFVLHDEDIPRAYKTVKEMVGE